MSQMVPAEGAGADFVQRMPIMTAVTPADLLRIAMEKGENFDRLEKLMEMVLRWEANEARKAFVSDMAEFKKNPPTIYKDKKGQSEDGETEFMHATLGNVVEKIVVALAQHGFSHKWVLIQDTNKISVTCVITHRLGHSEETELYASPDSTIEMNEIQAIALTVSYLERYTLLAGCGLATRDQPDLDGHPIPQRISLLDKWCAKARAATTIPELNELRKQGAEEFCMVSDIPGWNKYKVVIEDFAETLRKGGDGGDEEFPDQLDTDDRGQQA